MINAGIVGLGWWGKTLVEAVSGQSDQFQFVAGTTEDESDDTQAFAAQHEFELLTDFDAMVANPNVDAVVLATPNSMHVDQVVAAAVNGKHVFCEKPLALTKAGAKRAVDATEKAGVTLGAIFPRRFMDSTLALKKAIDDDRFGGLCLADVYIKWYRTQEYYDSGGWRGTWALDGGGALMNQGIHGIDLDPSTPPVPVRTSLRFRSLSRPGPRSRLSTR